jgi:hypothetical protein
MYLLSLAPFDRQPYIVVDYKSEKLFRRSDRIRQIGYKEIPKHPGVYILDVLPGEEDEIEDWLWRVWSRRKIGLYIDEGYSIGQRSQALQAILTQGRSLEIPVYYLSQRPSWISQFVLSEADFYAVFQLNKREDRQRIQAMIPEEKADVSNVLPDYNSYWYDVAQNHTFIMRPVPSDDLIIQNFDERLKPERKAV